MSGMKIICSRAALVLALPVLLAGCESSSRLNSLLPESRISQERAAPPPLTPAPSSQVESSSLPPPPGSGQGGLAPNPAPNHGSIYPNSSQPSGVGTAPGNLPSAPAAAAPLPAPRVATAPTTPNAAPSRSSVTGSWTLSESAGNRCKITLSSAPKLDLYGASTSGCQSKDLQKINAWELNGNEVILYEPGGAVSARLRQSGEASYNGAAARSGAPISLSK